MSASFATSETDDHPEVTEISALNEGILPSERAAQVRSHLTHCPLCEEVRSSLEEIRDMLGTLPGPTRMPEDIAGRIDAALAAEALLGPAEPSPEEAASSITPGSSESPSAPDTPDTSPSSDEKAVSRETASVSRETTSPATAPATSGSHASGTAATRRPPGHPSGSTGPGRGGGRTRRRRRILLATAGACAALALGGVLLPTLLTNEGQQTADQGTAAPAPDDINAAQLEGRVQKLLADSASAETRESSSARDEGEPEPATPSAREDRDAGISPEASPTGPFGAESAAALPTCVAEGIDRPETPLVATRQSYEGSDSFLVVFPHPGDSARVDAYVVDARCDSSGSDGPGQVLANETVPRG